MNEHEMNFKFKGDRAYVQGGDIVQEFVNVVANTDFDFNENTVLDVKFLRTTNSNLLLTDSTEAAHDACVSFVFILNGVVQKKWFALELNKKVNARYEYSEDLIKKNTSCDVPGEVTCARIDTYTFIEQIIAMTKILNVKDNQEQGSSVKWFFAGTSINYASLVSENSGSLRIALAGGIKNRFSKSEIYMNEKKIGVIKFASENN